ncbi:hypothetical protein ATK30_6834 [Amycolatopsis echigonensis]|uniref:Uncharacterized protein n=1 Tax=Amycolatopsis echigonensis TaxID=2576905 RepID=A0A2N3WPU3_9PSEU|nr:hypothetical protein [Amycolatopsis niigatensis]PKV95901.1 hypothetical protein ATK30_6834 [Amycolatopsis niigatensis]
MNEPIPVYTTSRLRVVVTAYLAQVRAGRITLDEAEARVVAAFDSLERQRAAAALLRDQEVTGNREGKVAADPAITSARAARSVQPRTGTQRAAILQYVVEAPNGVTDFEISRDMRILPNSVRPRRNELADGGYVVDSGQTRQHRGSSWAVWVATDEARAWYGR